MGIILPPLCFLKNNLQRSAEIAVVTIDITDLKELSASSIDAGTLEYEHIRGELKGLEKENSQLKKLVADLSLNNSILKEVAQGNF